MNWLLRNWRYTLLGLGLALIAALLLQRRALQIDVQHLQKENSMLSLQRDEAQWLLAKQVTSLHFFNETAQKTERDKQQSQVQSEKRQTIIKTVLLKESCAELPVPDAIVERLRSHADQIRSSATHSHPSQPVE